MNAGQARRPPRGFEARLEAELVKVVTARGAARPGIALLWRRPGLVERVAGRLLRSPGLARALVTTPSLLLPWLIARVVGLAPGAAATLGTGKPLVALLAPAVAGAGIAC